MVFFPSSFMGGIFRICWPVLQRLALGIATQIWTLFGTHLRDFAILVAFAVVAAHMTMVLVPKIWLIIRTNAELLIRLALCCVYLVLLTQLYYFFS